MSPENCLTHLILGVIAGLPAVILAIATLMQVLKQGKDVQQLDQRVNGRLEALIAAREELAEMRATARFYIPVGGPPETPSRTREIPKPRGADDTVPFERPDPPAA